MCIYIIGTIYNIACLFWHLYSLFFLFIVIVKRISLTLTVDNKIVKTLYLNNHVSIVPLFVPAWYDNGI